MNKIKCLISIVLGVFLGLLSACTNKESDSKPQRVIPPGPTEIEPPANTNQPAGKTNALPPNQENLPVREPMLE